MTAADRMDAHAQVCSDCIAALNSGDDCLAALHGLCADGKALLAECMTPEVRDFTGAALVAMDVRVAS